MARGWKARPQRCIFRDKLTEALSLSFHLDRPVFVGVVAYPFLSRSGPFGRLGLLYSPPVMTLAQTTLVVPLMAALTRQIVEDAWREYPTEVRSMHFSLRHSAPCSSTIAAFPLLRHRS